ncbi:hypothetical protein LTR97_004395 [Elasticomyces elasticus]|uniref:NEDD8-activating enzyme E1 regulatory subunit n=1 Tax=Elasticomyces elasticus TaxID=574655 RepID=A0AAN7WAI3_9PEZI|nr:hypothetical protein LTR97_004395 [Elasticomyces elasticus]KAK5724801.1 hypothetical protein LTR15_004850 [Elasticomyces elasticus]
MASETIPPLLDIPKAKEKKYDRQLRLWGASGQMALEETHILLINSGPGVTGVETLKNLVLPGVGQFTILDSTVVSEADLGVNFFLDDTSLGKFRAEETVRLLMELNPGVQGHAITEPLESFITKDDVFAHYNLILAAAPIDSAILERIQTHAQSSHIPAFYYHSVGYMSSFSVLLPPAFPIVDTHPDPTATMDLRLLKPWPALSQFAVEKVAGLEEGTISAPDKAHIPWVCLLLHYLEQWKRTHDGKVPDNYKEKTEFRNMVRAGDPNEENFEEASAAVLKSLNLPTMPSAVREIMAAPEIAQIDASSPSFWLIAEAVVRFYTGHQVLPLPGAVPDMKAQSADYVELQNIYKSKAREDCAEVLATVRDLEKQIGRPPKQAVDEKEVENFCKGAAHIHLVRGRPFQITQADQVIKFGDRASAMVTELKDPESLIGLHIAFLAWDEYVATHTSPASQVGGAGLKMPGIGVNDFDIDTQRVTGIAHKTVDRLINEAGTTIQDADYSEAKDRVGKFCREIVRAGGGELHNIASLTGGLLAQEVIKVVTRQYVPVDNTCLFDGVASRTQVLRI